MTRFSFEDYFQNSLLAYSSLPQNIDVLSEVGEVLCSSLSSGGTIFWFGNGGSASDSLHLSAELVGKFKIDREPLRSISLNSNQANLTAIANDYGFEQIFARQIKALGRENDVAIGISTSGKSENVLLGLEQARKLGIKTVLFTGAHAFNNSDNYDFLVCAPSIETAHVQECHIAMGQALCGYVEQKLNQAR
jgi:D-sedoheptulose 7-phosphate isomerase